MKKIGVAVIPFLLMSILGIPAFAVEKEAVAIQAVEKEAVAIQRGDFQLSVLEPVKSSFIKLGGYVSELSGVLLILIIGAVIAIGFAVLVEWLLELIQFEEEGVKKTKIPEILKKGGIGLSLSELITEIVFFLIIIVTFITALEFYGLGTSAITTPILSYIPHVIASVFILILGILLAAFVSGIITLVGGNVEIAQSDLLGNIAKYVIIIAAGLIALKELGLGVILTDRSKDIILAGLVLALALGTKDKVGEFLNKVFKK